MLEKLQISEAAKDSDHPQKGAGCHDYYAFGCHVRTRAWACSALRLREVRTILRHGEFSSANALPESSLKQPQNLVGYAQENGYWARFLGE
jgi:hypothetical protein